MCKLKSMLRTKMAKGIKRSQKEGKRNLNTSAALERFWTLLSPLDPSPKKGRAF